MDKIGFKVVPYALQDTIEALLHNKGKNFYNEITVTKEDGDLVIYCNKKYITSLADNSTKATNKVGD